MARAIFSFGITFSPRANVGSTIIIISVPYACTARSDSLNSVAILSRQDEHVQVTECWSLRDHGKSSHRAIAHLQEATWHPLEAGTGRNTSTPYAGLPQDCGVSPPLSKDGEPDNNNSGAENLTYLRHLELEPIDPLTGLPLHPGFTARGGRTPCTVTRRLIRQAAANQVSPCLLLQLGYHQIPRF